MVRSAASYFAPSHRATLVDVGVQLVIVMACASLMTFGFELLSFERLSQRAEAMAESEGGQQAVEVYRELAVWSERLGVMGAARRLQVSLATMVDVEPPARDQRDPAASGVVQLLEEDLVRTLTVSPSDASLWLALAQLRWDRDARSEAMAAWRMAATVAPREGAILDYRVSFALQRWDDLDDAFRGMTLRDLALMLASSLQMPLIKAALAEQDDDVRGAVVDGLDRLVVLTPRQLAKAGLSPAQPPSPGVADDKP